jgi:hypothetical protein
MQPDSAGRASSRGDKSIQVTEDNVITPGNVQLRWAVDKEAGSMAVTKLTVIGVVMGAS